MADYEVIWSGTLEREGRCKSLSNYEGPSSLGCVHDETLEHGEVRAVLDAAKPKLPRRRPEDVRDEVERQLRAGCSYRAIAGAVRCSVKLVRNVASAIGIDRSIFCGQGLAKERKS